jgi:hypothetical protein
MARTRCSRHIYREWNARLFEEMDTRRTRKKAVQRKTRLNSGTQGRDRILWFLHHPLVKTLKDWGAIGVPSYEYLDYAERNRAESGKPRDRRLGSACYWSCLLSRDYNAPDRKKAFVYVD